MTNYEKFLNLSANEEEDDVLEMIKEGARAMKLLAGKLEGVIGVEEAVMCLVLTNAVEVQDKDGRNVGIAVYDWRFSWINHSCSPNACFRFVTTKTIPSQQVVEGESQLPRLRIYPAAMDSGAGDGLAGDCKSSEGCGPSIIVRSIKGIKKNERITITYTDLLQPKEMRQAELFTNYRFNCCCKRCIATPATYVDRALQEIFVSGVDGLNMSSNENSHRTKATTKFMDSIDGAIDEYLTFNNPQSCCEKLEDLLTHGHLQEPLQPKPEKSPQCIGLHLFHYQSLHAYTTLASAYRVRASDLLAFNPENYQHQMEAFTMSRTSAAYSLLLAMVTHHLFLSESSIVACAANFWKNAGESLVYLFRSSAWDTHSNLQQSVSENSSILSHKCYQIVQLDSSEANSFINIEDQYAMFGDISRQHINCIVILTEKVWSFLSHESRHLQEVKELIDFRWLLTVETPLDLGTRLTCRDSGTVSRLEEKEHTNLERAYLFQLGIHCLHYATYLSNICYGRNSLLTGGVWRSLYSEGMVAG